MMLSPLEERPVEGPETDETEALRQIDSHMRGSVRRGMAPRGEDYLGGIPLSSPAGEALGGAVESVGGVIGSAMGGVQDAARFGYDNSPSRLIERGFEASADAGQQFQDMIRWAITPRGARSSAAFVNPGADPRSYTDGASYAEPLSKPTASQNADYAAGLPSADDPEGWRDWLDGAAADSSKVSPTVSTKPGQGQALKVAMGGGPLEEYVPGESADIGAPGRGGFMPSADPESMPVGQRPQSYFDDLATSRAIERGAPAIGGLAGSGLTQGEAGQFRGHRYVNENAMNKQAEVERLRQGGPVRTREAYAAEMAAIEDTHRQALTYARMVPIPPRFADLPEQQAREEMRKAVEERTRADIQAVKDKYEISQRMNARGLNDTTFGG